MTEDSAPPRRPKTSRAEPRTESRAKTEPKAKTKSNGKSKPASPKTKPASGQSRSDKSAAGKAAPEKPRSGKAGHGGPATRKADAAPARHGPRGFGGWLWLLAIGQLVVTARMIDTLLKLKATIGTELWQDHPGIVIADLTLYGTALALQLAVLVAMVLGRRLFVPLFIASIAAYFLIGRIEPLLAIVFLGMSPDGLFTRAAVTALLIELAVGLVWGAYVLRSRRVRNTFVR